MVRSFVTALVHVAEHFTRRDLVKYFNDLSDILSKVIAIIEISFIVSIPQRLVEYNKMGKN